MTRPRLKTRFRFSPNRFHAFYCSILILFFVIFCESSSVQYHSVSWKTSGLNKEEIEDRPSTIPVYYKTKNSSCDESPYYFQINVKSNGRQSGPVIPVRERIYNYFFSKSNNPFSKSMKNDFVLLFGMINDLEIDRESYLHHIHILAAFPLSVFSHSSSSLTLPSIESLCATRYFTYFFIILDKSSPEKKRISEAKEEEEEKEEESLLLCDRYLLLSRDQSLLFLHSSLETLYDARCSMDSDLYRASPRAFQAMREAILLKARDFLLKPALRDSRHYLRFENSPMVEEKEEEVASVRKLAELEQFLPQIAPLLFRLDNSLPPSSRPSSRPTHCSGEPTSSPSAAKGAVVPSHLPTSLPSHRLSRSSVSPTSSPTSRTRSSSSQPFDRGSLPPAPSLSPSVSSARPSPGPSSYSNSNGPSSSPSSSPAIAGSPQPQSSSPSITAESSSPSLSSPHPSSIAPSPPSVITESPSIAMAIAPSPSPSVRPSSSSSPSPSPSPSSPSSPAVSSAAPQTTGGPTSLTSLLPSALASLFPTTLLPSAQPSSGGTAASTSFKPSFRPSLSPSPTLLPSSLSSLFFNSSSNSSSVRSSFLQTTTFIGSVSAAGTVGVATTATASYYALQVARTVLPGLPAAPVGLAGTV